MYVRIYNEVPAYLSMYKCVCANEARYACNSAYPTMYQELLKSLIKEDTSKNLHSSKDAYMV